MQSTQILLSRRPVGEPTAADFDTVTVDLPPLEDGQVLLRVVYLSLDPYMRGRMSDAESYADPVELGGVMVGATVCEVLESRVAQPGGRRPGAVLLGLADARRRRCAGDAEAGPGRRAGVDRPGGAGHAGVHGVRRAARDRQAARRARRSWSPPRPDRSARRSARSPGSRAPARWASPGEPEKCRALVDEFGFDAAVDHRAPDFRDRLADAVPDGIDVYFENVGGEVGRAVLRHLNLYARIPVCGLVAGYNATEAARGAGPAGRLHAPGADQEPHRARLHPERVRARAPRPVPRGDVGLGRGGEGPLPRGRHGGAGATRSRRSPACSPAATSGRSSSRSATRAERRVWTGGCPEMRDLESKPPALY